MIELLVTLIVIALLVGLLWWVCDYLPVPEPVNKILKFAAIIVAVFVIVWLLLNLAGYSGPRRLVP